MNGMYNRYIPQSDGTYRRKSMPEPPRPQPQPQPQQRPEPEPIQEQEALAEIPEVPPMERKPQKPPRRTAAGSQPKHEQSAKSFLSGLIPRDIDAGDLAVILLLLLLGGEDGKDDTALLTLAMYFMV